MKAFFYALWVSLILISAPSSWGNEAAKTASPQDSALVDRLIGLQKKLLDFKNVQCPDLLDAYNRGLEADLAVFGGDNNEYLLRERHTLIEEIAKTLGDWIELLRAVHSRELGPTLGMTYAARDGQIPPGWSITWKVPLFGYTTSSWPGPLNSRFLDPDFHALELKSRMISAGKNERDFLKTVQRWENFSGEKKDAVLALNHLVQRLTTMTLDPRHYRPNELPSVQDINQAFLKSFERFLSNSNPTP